MSKDKKICSLTIAGSFLCLVHPLILIIVTQRKQSIKSEFKTTITCIHPNVCPTCVILQNLLQVTVQFEIPILSRPLIISYWSCPVSFHYWFQRNKTQACIKWICNFTTAETFVDNAEDSVWICSTDGGIVMETILLLNSYLETFFFAQLWTWNYLHHSKNTLFFLPLQPQ